jgi:hypothetical protein
MKTLSIKQPWAYLICSGIKDIENRTWQTKFRGRVLVHASAKRCNINEIFTNKQWEVIGEENRIECVLHTSPVSAIIGSVEIVDCVINHESIWAEKTIGIIDLNRGLHESIYQKKTIYNWVIANPILFENPILNVKGKLSFWDYPALNDVVL